MIQTLQKFSQSRIAKIFLAIVALSFVVFFGGGSWFRPHNPLAVVAHVGELSISRQEFVERLHHALAQTNKSTNQEDLLKAGLPQIVVNQLIQETLLNLEGENLGLTVSDEALRQYIHSMKAFQNEKGVFDRTHFTQVLRVNGIVSEDAFIATIRQELMRNQLINAIVVGAYLPDEMVERLFEAQYQYRQASMLLVSPQEMPTPPLPSNEVLEAFYQDHQKEFKTPELRTITALVIDPTLISKEISVSPEEIKAMYEAKPEVYGKHPLDKVTPLIITEIQKEKSSEKTYQLTQEVDDKIAGGATFEELAPILKGAQLMKLEAVDAQGRDRMATSPPLPQNKELTQEILKTSFSLEEGADSPFAQAQNGAYYAVRIDKIIPAAFQPFAEIKERILKIWLESEQLKAAYLKAEKYVNAFNHGDRKVSLMTLLPNLSLSEPSPAISDEVKNLVFSLRPGQAGMARTAEGFTVVVLNTIIPPQRQVKEDKMASFKEILLNQYQSDLLMSYLNALRVRYPVKVNKEAMKAASLQ